MLEHRAAVQQQLVQQEAEGLRRLNLDREQVLARLWEIANLSPEMTRNSITGQVKALSMIVAMENFIPDRRAVSAEKKSAPAPAQEEGPPGVPGLPPSSVGDPLPHPGPSQSTFANRFTPSEAPPLYVPLFNSVPDLGIPFSTKKNPLNPFVHPR